ncbi:hypothetical protein REPUB_Repub16aG0097200 [Reevesia pubescens]
MEESLRADQATMEAKERECAMLIREKDRMIAVKEAEEKLVADFLEVDGNKNSDDQKVMLDSIVALMNPCTSDDSNNGKGFGGDYGKNQNPEKVIKCFSKPDRLNSLDPKQVTLFFWSGTYD